MSADILTWVIAVLATGGVVTRPLRWPEAVWAVIGAALLVVLGLLPWRDALHAIHDGLDVYLFLIGMMLLSEVARREGLFDWLAARAAGMARGSARRLFLLVYAVGVLVTAFLSNDACAVVLTPAVCASARAAKAPPLPYLFACAFIANAASFVLPISNPANIVLYASNPPRLGEWLGRFALPAIASIVATYIALRLVERRTLLDAVATDVPRPPLARGGRTAVLGIFTTALVLLAASALGWKLGLPTAACGAATAAVVQTSRREAPWRLLAGITWSVIPLVAGLFVLVAGLTHTGVIAALAALLQSAAHASLMGTAWGAGVVVAIGCNLTNNLPAGRIAAAALGMAHPLRLVADSLLVGVDLGPNLSVTGSLATILWLISLRREGIEVSFWRFLRVGACVMPPALLLALLALTVRG